MATHSSGAFERKLPFVVAFFSVTTAKLEEPVDRSILQLLYRSPPSRAIFLELPCHVLRRPKL
jgi:hypothetical protein